MQRDPYERKMVEVRGSWIEGAAEGLFAERDLEMNTVVSFYNGVPVSLADEGQGPSETNNYKIFDPEDIHDGTIDIPAWAQVDILFLFLSNLYLDMNI